MFRLLQGDVGSGKTIVSLISALNVIESNFQVALLAPTEILAKQHFNFIKSNFSNRYKVEILTGKTEYKKQQKEQNTLVRDLPDLSSDIVDSLKKLGVYNITEMLAADENKITGPDGISPESLETVYNTIQLFLTIDESNDDLEKNSEIELEKADEELVQKDS